ncbi:MAG: hypothetical protein E7311_02590 [Clostridiales bacterium]|nr:hypothetical protein [Clostridiales bacterium]
MFKRIKKKNNVIQNSKPSIIVQTSYGTIEIVNLKSVWINYYLGTCRLMYQDDIYEYNCIYWTDTNAKERYIKLKQKLIDAYNRGDKIVEL